MTDSSGGGRQEPARDPLAIAAGGLDEFEARLGTRTKVPAERVSEFLQWPEEKIRREAQVVTRVLKRFAKAVVASMEEPSHACEFLRSLDLKTISRDHDWRAVFSTIRAREEGYEEFQRGVLVKYLQYLSFRKRLLDFIYARRQGLEETDGYTELTHFPLSAGPGDTDEGGAGGDGEERARLPMGEGLVLELGEGAKLELMLAAHLYRLVGGRPPSLIDQNGVTYFLRCGRNMLGRHPESDVVVDQNFGDISRAHLIIEWDGREVFTITDLSARGTYVRPGELRGVARPPTPD